MTDEHTAKAFRFLDRHQQRRAQSIPTLSVLLGPKPQAQALWTDWLTHAARPGVVWSPQTATSPIQCWLDYLDKQRALLNDAHLWLCNQLGESPEELSIRLRSQSPHERTLFFLSLEQRLGPAPALIATECLLQSDKKPPTAALLEPIQSALGAQAVPTSPLAALASIVPPQALPAMLADGASLSASALDSALSPLLNLVQQLPQVPFALLLLPKVLDDYYRIGPETQRKALLREGTILLECSQEKPSEPPALPAEPVEKILGRPAPAKLQKLWTQAQQFTETKPQSETQSNQARSAAEQFLFEMLEQLAQTQGRFQLNGRLAVPFGNHPWTEVDLLCLSPKVAVEIDGYYHFQNEEAYRRDRRKDLLLQRQGFLVIRFLANDIVRCLEQVLKTICESLPPLRGAKGHP